MKHLMIVAAVAALLAGCASPEQRQALYQARCAALGVLPFDPRYYDCMLHVETLVVEREAARQAPSEAGAGFQKTGDKIRQ
jgi:hypothetical protein